METRTYKCLVTAAPDARAPGAAALINSHPKLTAVVCHDAAEARAELFSRTVHAVVLGASRNDPDPFLLAEAARQNASLAHIPLLVPANPANPQIVRNCLTLGASLLPEIPGANAHPDDETAFTDQIVSRLRAIYHPASLLQTGAVLGSRLSGMTHNVEKLRYVLLIKLLGLKSYNIYKSYPDGDDMLAELAATISELLAQRGNHNTVLGHLSSDEFLIITHDRRVESLCRTILNQGQRIFRKFYTPYELMQGYITVEDEHYSGNYYLAEVLIAGAEIPTQWDSHPVYVLDILKELLGKVEKDDSKFKIITL